MMEHALEPRSCFARGSEDRLFFEAECLLLNEHGDSKYFHVFIVLFYFTVDVKTQQHSGNAPFFLT